MTTPASTFSRLVALAPHVVEHRFGLFDHETYVRQLAPLLTLAVQGQDNGAFASWVTINQDRLKHPEHCTFLHEVDWHAEFVEFNVGEYARFALTAFCEPETFRRLGSRVPALLTALRLGGASEEQAAHWLLGEPVEHGAKTLMLATGERVGLLAPADVAHALAAGRHSLAKLREPGASQRLLPVVLPPQGTEAKPATPTMLDHEASNGQAHVSDNGHGHTNAHAAEGNGATINGAGAGTTSGSSRHTSARISQRYHSARALRHALEPWCDLLEEAHDVGVGLLYLFATVDADQPRNAASAGAAQ